jgi:hypothetical protein
LIGICGGIGSGKDTVADHLVFSHGFKRIVISERIKTVCVDVLELPYENFFASGESNKLKDAPLPRLGRVPASIAPLGGPWPKRAGLPWTARWVAEFVGTECFQGVYGPVWVEKVVKEIAADRAQYHYLRGENENFPAVRNPATPGSILHVIPGVRFGHDVVALRAIGGVIWRTWRQGNERSTGHASDKEWRSFEVDAEIIASSGDLQGLRHQADELLAGLRFEEKS